MTSSTKNYKPKTKFFFHSKLQDFTSLYRVWKLSSSICCWVMAGQNLAWNGKLYLWWNFFIFVKNWIFEPKFSSKYARKPTRALKAWMIAQIIRKTWSKNLVHWVGAQGRVNLAKKAKKCPDY